MLRNHSFNCYRHAFLHTDAHVLTRYAGNEEKILPTELVFNHAFQNSHI